MKQKPLKIITVVVSVVVLVVLFSNNKSTPQKEESNNVNNINEALASNYNDSLRAISARADVTEKKIGALDEKNKVLVQLNRRLIEEKEKKQGKSGALLSRQLSVELSKLKQEVESLKTQKIAPVDFKDEYLVKNANASLEGYKTADFVIDIDEMQSHQLPSKAEGSYWEKLEKRRQAHFRPPIVKSRVNANPKSQGIPYYTIPAGSDLGGTTLLSALIGEVPNNNKLAQPLFPFSAIISRGSLMSANGVPLPPDIKGMKVGGYAVGVGSFLDNISCARAYVTSALFVFQDGHFEVVGNENMKGASDLMDNQALGYLTNQYGNPCIRGTYHTNAPRALAVMTGASTLSGLGKGLAQSQTSYSIGGGGIASAPTGSVSKIMLGSGFAEGAGNAGDWLKERIKGSFDMVFVPASIPCRTKRGTCFRPNRLTLHLTKTIEINKNTQGRRIGYGKNQSYISDYSLK